MENPFIPEYKELTLSQKEKVASIKEKAQILYEDICTAFDANPRHIAVAKTKLEELVMWAVKGVTNPVETEVRK
jgi:hypothetical protein